MSERTCHMISAGDETPCGKPARRSIGADVHDDQNAGCCDECFAEMLAGGEWMLEELEAEFPLAGDPFQPGSRVWYEPSAGLKFAGVVVGDGSLPDTRRVMLTGHYWQWKSSKGQRERFVNAPASAISVGSLTWRLGDAIRGLDG